MHLKITDDIDGRHFEGKAFPLAEKVFFYKRVTLYRVENGFPKYLFVLRVSDGARFTDFQDIHSLENLARDALINQKKFLNETFFMDVIEEASGRDFEIWHMVHRLKEYQKTIASQEMTLPWLELG